MEAEKEKEAGRGRHEEVLVLCAVCVCVAIDVAIMLCAFAEWRVFADVVTRPNFGQFSNRMSELFRLA